MRLANPEFLILLGLIPFFIPFWLRKNTPARFGFALQVPKQMQSLSSHRILLFIRIIALASLILGLARPQTVELGHRRRAEGIDIVLVLDVSQSMNIEDFADTSRIQVAKELIRDFIRGRRDDRIGLVIFSGEPLALAPPTLDYGLLTQALERADTGILKDGTAIGDGLAVAVSRLKESKAKSRVVILLTDGDNNVGQLEPLTAGDLAVKFDVKVYTIAVGTEGRKRLPFKTVDSFGNPVVQYQWYDNSLNPELLIEISKRTNGKFYRATDVQGLRAVFSDIDRLERTKQDQEEKPDYKEEYFPFLVFGLMLLLIESLFRFWVWRPLL